jgi:hypothetical protein
MDKDTANYDMSQNFEWSDKEILPTWFCVESSYGVSDEGGLEVLDPKESCCPN